MCINNNENLQVIAKVFLGIKIPIFIEKIGLQNYSILQNIIILKKF